MKETTLECEEEFRRVYPHLFLELETFEDENS